MSFDEQRKHFVYPFEQDFGNSAFGTPKWKKYPGIGFVIAFCIAIGTYHMYRLAVFGQAIQNAEARQKAQEENEQLDKAFDQPKRRSPIVTPAAPEPPPTQAPSSPRRRDP